jgi:hypothetical protein
MGYPQKHVFHSGWDVAAAGAKQDSENSVRGGGMMTERGRGGQSVTQSMTGTPQKHIVYSGLPIGASLRNSLREAMIVDKDRKAEKELLLT